MTDVIALLTQAKAELEERRLEIERLRSSLLQAPAERSRRIAVVGGSVRLPGGIATLDELWQALLEGRVQGAPLERHRGYEESDFWRRARQFTGRLSALEDPCGFDHRFFRMSPREVRQVDPQQRLILELGWEALENAALAPAAVGKGGVFVGLSSDDYQRLGRSGCVADDVDAYAGTGTHRSMAAGRLAAFLGWTGPALQVDTACSSSLVAVQLACQALRSGDVDVALAGGCHLVFDPASVVERGALGALAPDGRCKPFEAEANGFGMGEGGAMVVLRRYDDAVRDGDPIVGVIHGVAVNHNGAGAGITVPNPAAQAQVMRSALADAGAQPDDVLFLEAHGTGTRLGDPIEAGAIESVFGGRDQPLPIGSIKANFGHIEAGAGIISLLKALLVQREATVPPTPASGPDSPIIRWEDLSLRVPRAAEPLSRRSGRDRVGVSSFGMSGTNCHLIVGSAPTSPPAAAERQEPLPILISASDEAALRALCARLADRLRDRDTALPSFARTLAVGRAHLSHRVGYVAATREEALGLLERLADGEVPDGAQTSRVVQGACSVRLHASRLHAGETAPVATVRTGCAALCIVAHGALAADPETLEALDSPEDARRLLVASLWASLLAEPVVTSLPATLSASRSGRPWTVDELRDAAADLIAALAHPSDAGVEAVDLDLDALLPEISGAAGTEYEASLRKRFSEALVMLFCRNVPLRWSNVAGLEGARIALPTYPFQRRPYEAARSASRGSPCC